jgi:hypothetical protein
MIHSTPTISIPSEHIIITRVSLHTSGAPFASYCAWYQDSVSRRRVPPRESSLEISLVAIFGRKHRG